MLPVPRLGPYELVTRIGLSSSAEVYAARHLETGEEVSIKRLLPHANEDDELREGFDEEIKRTLQSNQKGLIRGIELLEAPSASGTRGEACLVMEFISGESFSELLKRKANHPPTQSVLVHVAQELASILEGLHQRAPTPWVHGDLSAKNLMIGNDGEFTLIDLGSLGPAGASPKDAGTPRYAAPERRNETQALSPCLDVYSLGVLLWELASGRRWQQGEQGDLPAESALKGSAIETLIMRATAPEMDSRPKDASELKRALRALATPTQGREWLEWISEGTEQASAPSKELSNKEGIIAWTGLLAALTLILWVGLWFIAQMQ